MTAHRKSRAAKGDYKVGYGRPPAETRFQARQSGNPRGRPKGIKSLAQLLKEKFARRVTVQENGRPRKMGMLEVLIQKLINDAAHGNLRAMRPVLDLWERSGEVADQDVAVTDLGAEDRAIIAAFLQKAQTETKSEDAPRASQAGTAAGAEALAAQPKGWNHDGNS